MAALGAIVDDAELPRCANAYEPLETIVSWEAGHTHRRHGLWPPNHRAYDADVRRRLERADQVTAAEYADAQAERELLRDELASAFGSFDLLLSLTSGSDPIAVAPGGGDVGFRRAAMACAAPQSLAGLPACALPAGRDERHAGRRTAHRPARI